jgi:outer membrane usher protein
MATARLLLAATLVATSAAVSLAQDGPAEQAVLDLTVNTVSRGQIRVLIAGDDVWADVEGLKAAGLVNVSGEEQRRAGARFVRLDSIAPRPKAAVDLVALTLTITADPSLFARSVLTFDGGRPRDVVFARSTSAFVNYGATWSSSWARALNLEPGITIGQAFATSSFYLPSDGRASRGVTAVILDDRDRLRRYQIGDTVAATGPLGGAIQLAGVSVSRDFSLDPYFIRYPTTGLSGIVTTPSRVDLYVNNQLVRTLQIQPGAYELANLALPTGAADTRVVVRDAFGGQQEFGGSYYVTTSVLARGLHQYQYAVGAERLRPFDSVWDYGRPIVTAFHRVGVSDTLTVGGRAEVERGLVSGGATATARAGRFGAVELSGGVSQTGRTGLAAGVAYEYIGRHGGLSVGWRRASDEYETLTTRRSLRTSVNELLASLTYRLSGRVSGGLSWQSQDSADRHGLRRAAATTSIAVAPGASLFLSASRSRLDGFWSTGVFASLTLSVGPRATASLSAEREGTASRGGVDFQQSAPLGPGFGFRGQVSGLGSTATLVDGEVRAQNRWGQVELRQSTVEGRRETWAQVNGAFVAIGGRVHASRPVQNGFALVRVPEVSGVRTYLSHQEVGRTDARGDLLVPNLLPYYGNRLSIDDTDVPIDRTVTLRDVTLAPPYRGGAIALFPAPRERRITGRLIADGDMPALEGQRALDAVVSFSGPSRAETWLAADGEFYIVGLEPGAYVIDVTAPDLRCRASLHIPGSELPVIRLGEVRCGGVTP